MNNFLKVLILFVSVSISAAESTNFLPSLKVGNVNYSNAIIRSVTATDLIISFQGGGARVALSNLPPDLQKRFGYDAKKATAFALAEKEKKERTKAQYDSQASQLSTQRAYANALASAQQQYEAQVRALRSKLESATTQAQQLRLRLSSLRTESDRAWNRYVYTDSSYFQMKTGQTEDNEANRLAYAQSVDRQISDTIEAIPLADEARRKSEKEYEKELPRLTAQYKDQIASIHETFRTSK